MANSYETAVEVRALLSKGRALAQDLGSWALRGGDQIKISDGVTIASLCDALEALLQRHTAEAGEEAIARTTDPGSWVLIDHWLSLVERPDLSNRFGSEKAPSLAKARQIIALSPSKVGEGVLREAAENVVHTFGGPAPIACSFAEWLEAVRHSVLALRAALSALVGKDLGLDQSGLQTCAADSLTTAPTKRTMTLNLTDAEMAALEELVKAKDLSPPNIFRQALKLYQLQAFYPRQSGSGSADVVETAPNYTSVAALDVLAERRRQITGERWSHKHDDEHSCGDLAKAGACYALGTHLVRYQHRGAVFGGRASEDWVFDWTYAWPWDESDWKRKDDRSNLIRAAALIIAEIERLDRALRIGESDEPSATERPDYSEPPSPHTPSTEGQDQPDEVRS